MCMGNFALNTDCMQPQYASVNMKAIVKCMNVNKKCCFWLPYGTVTQLVQYCWKYCQVRYCTLTSLWCLLYELEKEKARHRNIPKEFPLMYLWQPKSGPLLTAKETEMCQGMVAIGSVFQSHHFVYKDDMEGS